jgi:hypothetical protein
VSRHRLLDQHGCDECRYVWLPAPRAVLTESPTLPHPDSSFGRALVWPEDPFARLPADGRWIYEAFDGEGERLYIGQTTNPRLRMRSHCRLSEWFPLAAAVYFEYIPVGCSLSEIEKALIEFYRPRHNRSGVTCPFIPRGQKS